MKHILFILTITISTLSLSGQNVERPIQLQLNLQGPFMKVFGEPLSNQEIESFEVENWAIPGIMVGYHLSNRWYVGYNYQPNRQQSIVEPWGLSEQRQDANIMVAYETGHIHSLDLRFSPFKKGFYLQGSFMHISEADYHMNARPLGQDLQIGNGFYETDMQVNWNFKQVNTLALGLGYNHITSYGFSFGAGLLIPMINEPYQNIDFEPGNPEIDIHHQDLELASQRLQDETFYYPVQINLVLGYNFNWKK